MKVSIMSKRIVELNHPLIEHKLRLLRDKNTKSAVFRRIVHELTEFLVMEATQDLELTEVEIETPIAKTKAQRLASPPVIVSILRAGNGMVDGVLDLLPFCSVGFIGLYRDKLDHNAVEYYFKLPEQPEGKDIILVDPMLATANTAIAAIDRLKQSNVGKIKFLNILSSKHGIDRIHQTHPDVEIYTLSAKEALNDKDYLVPGLGDAGDRIFATL